MPIALTAPRYVSDNWWARASFLHELTHRFVAFYLRGGLPVWLNEEACDVPAETR